MPVSTRVPDVGRITWLVEALESGEYRKGQGVLHTPGDGGAHSGAWCCLGVASRVAIEHGLNITTRIATKYGSIYEVFAGYGLEMLSPAVQEWYGFADADPLLRMENFGVRRAASWNDVGQDGDGPEPDFTAIAAAFRRTYLGGTS